MKILLIQAWNRFKSEVPPIIKKLQIILGIAVASLTSGAAITWPGKLAVIGMFCGYAAAVCGGIILALQFIQQSVTVFENKTEVTVTAIQTTVSTELPISTNKI
jgi:TRAP-type C4-dicarboxylate transport system permease small subunit